MWFVGISERPMKPEVRKYQKSKARKFPRTEEC